MNKMRSCGCILSPNFGKDSPVSDPQKGKSADYFTPDTYANRERVRLKNQKHVLYSEAIHWSLAFVVGCVTGILASGIHEAYHQVAETRFELTNSVIQSSQFDAAGFEDGNIFAGYLIYLATMLGLVAIAFRLVYWAPGAFRTGIPDLLAYLNGVKIPKLFTFDTLIAKVIGVICAVASGLATGPEGPLIHIGGIIGSLTLKVYKYILIVFGGEGLSWSGFQSAVTRTAKAAQSTLRENALQVADTVQNTVSSIAPNLLPKREDAEPSPAALGRRRESRVSLTDQVTEQRTPLSWDMVLEEETDERDFVAIGAGCGVAAAFHAPVGGILFIVEEASSFFNIHVVWKGFFACVIAFWFAGLIDSADGASSASIVPPKNGGGGFSHLCESGGTLNVSDIVLFIVIGIVGGLLGAFFNWACANVARLRRDYIDPIRSRRYIEILSLCAVTSIVACLIPAMFDCLPLNSSLFLSDTTMCQTSGDFDQIFSMVKHVPGDGIDPSYFTNQTLCLSLARDPELAKDQLLEQEALYGTGYDLTGSTPVGFFAANPPVTVRNHLLVPYPGAFNSTLSVHSKLTIRYMCPVGYYNPFATLVLNPAATVVRSFFSKGNTNLFPPGVIIAFLIFYFILAVWTAGISIPTGLFIPMMVIGGSYGRIIGLIDVVYERWRCSANGSWVYLPDLSSIFFPFSSENPADASSNTCIPFCPTITDPGIFAIVGAASFMGGSGRITLFLAVVTMEITQDITLMTPITIGLLIAVWVGNIFNAGMYHELIHVKGLPFLYHETDLKHGKACAKHAMSSPVVSLPRYTEIRQLRTLLNLRKESYNCFPIVVSAEDPRILGSMLRSQLQELLAQLDYGYRRLKIAGGSEAEEIQDLDSQILDLVEYMDLSPICVSENFLLSRAYQIFRREALRHMFVVDSHNRVIGIISRKDLMPWAIPDTLPHGSGPDHMDDLFPGEGEYEGDDDYIDGEEVAAEDYHRDDMEQDGDEIDHSGAGHIAVSVPTTVSTATSAPQQQQQQPLVSRNVVVIGSDPLPESARDLAHDDAQDGTEDMHLDGDHREVNIDHSNEDVQGLTGAASNPRPLLSAPVQFLKDQFARLRGKDERGHRFSVPNIVEDVVPWQSADGDGSHVGESSVVFENNADE